MSVCDETELACTAHMLALSMPTRSAVQCAHEQIAGLQTKHEPAGTWTVLYCRNEMELLSTEAWHRQCKHARRSNEQAAHRSWQAKHLLGWSELRLPPPRSRWECPGPRSRPAPELASPRRWLLLVAGQQQAQVCQEALAPLQDLHVRGAWVHGLNAGRGRSQNTEKMPGSYFPTRPASALQSSTCYE